jgi:radical SAM-linked protein
MPAPGTRPRRPSDGPTRTTDQPPVVQRLIVRYAKRSRMRFASHRDIARAVERGVRRGRVPIAYSAGFSPHPRSLTLARPRQDGEQAEYHWSFRGPVCVPSRSRDQLNAALPDGIDVIDVTEEASSLSAMTFEASAAALPGVGQDEAAAAAERSLAVDSVRSAPDQRGRRMGARARRGAHDAGRLAGRG